MLSDSETREREDLSGIDSPPVPVSSSNVEEMIERGDPLFNVKPILCAPKPTKSPKNKSEGNHVRTGRPVVCRLRSSAVEF